jgi:hypothetical protein
MIGLAAMFRDYKHNIPLFVFMLCFFSTHNFISTTGLLLLSSAFASVKIL